MNIREMKNAPHGVSVIICCYNSSERIGDTLRHLANQQVPPDVPWEILLINNASTDDTILTAMETWAQCAPSNAVFRVITEVQPGQMYARKRGAQEALFEFLLFCDDDNWLHKDYVMHTYRVMQQDDTIGAAGGRNYPVTNADEYPEWFETYKDKYAIGIPANASGDVSHRGFVLGAGLITRKSLFLLINQDTYPSLLNGRNGNSLTTGDDFEYCKRLLLWDFKLYFDKELEMQHFIPRERLTIDYRDRLMAGIEQAGKVLYQYDRAIYLHRKNRRKNRWRLLFMSPFRLIISKTGLSSRKFEDEWLTFYYLAPFQVRGSKAQASIKSFLTAKINGDVLS
ncbi:MAG: glycosyltransferase [Chitinophaga sp.]|uniref:glycosyltransferase n=1 Tax=Chitinophaga sp. TaxID=1869181 RepID=UPI0025BDE501|nr:glycosyltransferase [Chitinophaga sp.]MBV8253038.1 glycosyltransferase [Chitinophaga sp.]